MAGSPNHLIHFCSKRTSATSRRRAAMTKASSKYSITCAAPLSRVDPLIRHPLPVFSGSFGPASSTDSSNRLEPRMHLSPVSLPSTSLASASRRLAHSSSLSFSDSSATASCFRLSSICSIRDTSHVMATSAALSGSSPCLNPVLRNPLIASLNEKLISLRSCTAGASHGATWMAGSRFSDLTAGFAASDGPLEPCSVACAAPAARFAAWFAAGFAAGFAAACI
mmetsp:Transcript_8326/g.31353  ORF Transcript_8326/g.31353 Transcript_8326/m.31353 type:complete len:224 (+) Transcript_8326:630-1301(+)